MKTKNRPLDICAAVTNWSDIEAQATDDAAEPRRLRRFSMVAYTGGPMDIAGFKHPVVVDLSGLEIASQTRPILRDHDGGQIVGHTNGIAVENNQLSVNGVISGAGPVAAEIVTLSKNGFPWQASIGAKARKMVFVPAGRQAMVNGQMFAGPLHVARKAVLGEISFVALGADEKTSAQVAASGNQTNPTEVFAMDFEKWVQAQGFELAELDETQTTNLKAIFAASQKKPEDEPSKEIVAGADADDGADDDDDRVARLRAEYADDLKRIDAIEEICGNEHRKIAATAIAEGWDVTRTELAVLRESRPKAPAAGSPTRRLAWLPLRPTPIARAASIRTTFTIR